MNNINTIEQELIENNKDFLIKIQNKINFYKDIIWIILGWEEIFFDRKQIWNFKTNYDNIQEKAISNNKELLNKNDFIELLKLFENNIELLKIILSINNDYIWWENWVIFNLSNNWNEWHIQENIKSNKRMFRLATIYKNKKL